MRDRLLPILLAAALCGCMAPTLRMVYQPTAAPIPLRTARLPRLFLDEVKEKSAWEYQFAPQAGQAVKEALALELDRLGVPRATDRSSADAVLRAELSHVSCSYDEFIVSIKLEFIKPDGAVAWSGSLLGMNKVKEALDEWNAPLSEALSDAVRQLGPALTERGGLAGIFGEAPAAASLAPAPPQVQEEPVVRSDIDELPAKRAASREDAFAVVIGIRRYQQPLPEADFADADARLVKSYLTDVLGYQDANVALLVNDQAMKGTLEKYFESWLPNRVRDGGEAFVYFSGHGAPNPRNGDAYLVPYDGDPTYLDKTAYPIKRLYAELGKLPAKKVTVAMDSCFSGAGGRSVLARGARPLVLSTATEALPDRLTVLSAAAGDQISHAYHDKGHGLFTYFLLKGIKEKGADLRAAYEYAAKQVPDIARREYNADQTPQWSGGR